MDTNAVFTRPGRTEQTFRQIALRTRGHSHGPVTRLVSPGDIGELIKRGLVVSRYAVQRGHAASEPKAS